VKLRLLVATIAISATQLWCVNEEKAGSSPDAGGADAGVASDAGEPDAMSVLPACSDSFCRVSFPGMEAVSLDAVWARNASEVWLVGSTGFAARFDGTTWERIETGTKAALHGVTGTEDGTVWAAGSTQELLRLNRGSGGAAEMHTTDFKAMIDAVSAFGSEIYAVGTTIKAFDFPPPQDPPMPDNIWRYGPSADGGEPSWLPVSPPCPMGQFEPECLVLRAVWVESSERQWFAGDEGKIFRTDTSGNDGSSDRIRLVETDSKSLRRLNGLWGFSGHDIWAVGDQGVTRHWNGEAWKVVPAPIISNLHGVWGSRSDNVWAVGEDGVVIHWDGTSWTVKDIPFSAEERPRFRAVAGTDNDVWIAGEGVLLRSRSAAGGHR
jgi:hypothetical protein